MGNPNTTGVCANCGEPVIWPNNTGSWVHYPAHPLNKPSTDCMAPHVLAKVVTIPGLSSTLKTANKR